MTVDSRQGSPGETVDRAGAHAARRARIRRRVGWLATVLVVVLVAIVIGPRGATFLLARGDVAHRVGDIDRLGAGRHRAAIVFGAGLRGERPSALLRDRIDAAVQLLDEGRVDLLVMSGDNSTEYYDEPTVMRHYAIEAGAPTEQVAADYAGRRTWDSCVRARRVFGIRDAVVVTNAFHVDRAAITCRAAGIDTTGYSVDDSGYRIQNRVVWRTRELAATGRALLDAWVLRPAPAVGGDTIDPYDPCALLASLAPSDTAESAATLRRFDCPAATPAS